MNAKRNVTVAIEALFVSIATFILSVAVVHAQENMSSNSNQDIAVEEQTNEAEPLPTNQVEVEEVKIQEEPEINEPVQEKPTEEKVIVKSGDTLTKIAEDHNTTYVRLFNANPSISNPDVINPGDEIVIPAEDAEVKERKLPVAKKPEPAPKTSKVVSEPKATPVKSTPAKKASVVASSSQSVWDKLAQCESSGNWSINSGNGYYGGLQFSLSSWQFVGGSGYPHQASKQEQINRAEKLLAIQGWGAWPACSAKLGLR